MISQEPRGGSCFSRAGHGFRSAHSVEDVVGIPVCHFPRRLRIPCTHIHSFALTQHTSPVDRNRRPSRFLCQDRPRRSAPSNLLPDRVRSRQHLCQHPCCSESLCCVVHHTRPECGVYNEAGGGTNESRISRNTSAFSRTSCITSPPTVRVRFLLSACLCTL